MKGHYIPYSAEEMAWLEANRLLVISDLHREFVLRFGRSDVQLRNLHALRKRKGWKTGRTGFFEKGQTPFNKGVPCEPGRGGRHPNARKTQFRKGERSGVAVRLYKEIGTERLTEDGYRERKIHDDFPPQSRWRAIHLIEWEEINGPLPAGYALKCLNGDRSDTSPANWEAIPRGVLARLNGGRFKKRVAYDAAEPAVKPVVMAIAKLEHRLTQAARRKRPAA